MEGRIDGAPHPEVDPMDWHRENSTERHIQFIPAEKGWLALFEESTEAGVRIHADPVIAWCLGAQDVDDGHHVVAFGQAVIGASPWMDKAENEEATHFFALVREEQLDSDFVAEIKRHAHRSREDILDQAERNREQRLQGHATWRRQHRTTKSQRSPLAQFKIF
jgi:hypothetical protein